MGHTPYGYRIENGIAHLDEEKADKVRKLYQGYLQGLSLSVAAKEAGIDAYHGTVGKMLRNKRYLGDGYYPAIIESDVFEQVEIERVKRAVALGRVWDEKEIIKKPTVPMSFTMGIVEQKYNNPLKQAEYAYSLIESEVIRNGT